MMVAGFSKLLSIGVDLMDGRRRSRSSSSSEDDEDSGAALALGMVTAGALLYSLGYLLQSWHSRHREYVADEAAVALTGTGALASALSKIERASWRTEGSERALSEQHPQFSHLYISSHSDRKSGFFGFVSNLLRSHPKTEERKQAIDQTLQKVMKVNLIADVLPEPQSTM